MERKVTSVFVLFSILLFMSVAGSQDAFATITGGFSDKGFAVIPAPVEVGDDDQQVDTIFAFEEQDDLILLHDVTVDLAALTFLPGIIPQDTSVSTATIIYDPVNISDVVGCVDFDELIIGIQFERNTLIAEDDTLGAAGTFYDNTVFRGIEVPPHPNADQVWFADANTICFDLKASTPGDTFRVITEGDHNTSVLWQVGVYDQSFSEMSLGDEFVTPYNANTNPTNDCGGLPTDDCVDPDFPGILGLESSSESQWTDELTIEFDSPECSEAMILYGREGIEDDNVFFDGILLGTVHSAEGVYQGFNFDVGAITAGPHTVVIEYAEPDNVFSPELITFEDGPPTEIITDFGTVITPTTHVTFKIDDGNPVALTALPDGIIIERGNPRYGFGSPAGGDQVTGMSGDFSLSNNIAKSTTVADWVAHDYVILFEDSVNNLRVDIYDFGDYFPEPGDNITLKVYSDAAATIEVGSNTILATNAGDNSIITLSVATPSDTIRSARIIDSQGDIGTAIDNVEFNFNPDSSSDNQHAIDAVSLICWEPKQSLHVSKFYDANVNGVRDNDEPEIADWLVEVAQFNGNTDIIVSSSTGLTTLWLDPEHGEYLISEEQVENWVPTNYEVPPIIITEFYSDETVTISSNTRVTVDDDETIVEFGNVCLGDGGAHSKGFWGNKNGQKLIDADDLDDLNILNLVDDDGTASDFTGAKDLKNWLKDARANNMAYMLSAQLAAMQLNVNHGVSIDAIVYAPGVDDGFVTVQELIDFADVELLAHPNTTSDSPDRDYQEALKDALDDGDNNLNFVQPDICEPFVVVEEEPPV